VDEELIILDQHGAHERILYEKLLKNLRGTPADLSVPVVVRLPVDLAPEVWNFEVELEALGFRVEPFGGGAVRLLAAPEPVMDPEGAFLGAIEALVGGEDLAKALACRGSTKFGESLGREEMLSLLREWAACEFREICPHGRPIVKRILLADLLREFGRV
jgi:DNA mismatch repair protein MutL